MYYQKEKDETLVMLTLAGEQQAYEVLVTRYQKTVVSSAMAITKSCFMAEDAAQDAFVTAWIKLNTLKEPEKYGAWVRKIAKNCALNMLNRYRSFLSFDTVENLEFLDTLSQNPAELYLLSEEKNQIHKSVGKLSEKVRQIIHLHYFENLSIAEIADEMRVSQGTVKWQLHDGRKRMRKELCAMNEKYSDTLMQRVMKKVEELKLWQFRNDKSGFDKVYKDVLGQVEELPESTKKQSALADVLMRGWWWLPGKKNDALFDRIVNAAIQGKNEEVMTFIVTREDSKLHGMARIEFIREKQIPRLEKAGFVKTLGREWFWLGYFYFREGKTQEGYDAYKRVEEILQKEDAHRVLLPYARKMEELLSTHYKEKSFKRYRIGACAEEYRYMGKDLRFWNSEVFEEGYMQSVDREVLEIFRNSSKCDGFFFADVSLGETFVGTDETTLTYASNNETVSTPAGEFEQCVLWITTHWNDDGKSVYKSYYKEGVGIVKHEHINGGITESWVLSTYRAEKGEGYLPFGEGNSWEYLPQHSSKAIVPQVCFTVSFANDEKVVLSSWLNVERVDYDGNSWAEMMGQIRCEYCDEKDGRNFICDVAPAIKRAEQLAVSPMEKVHTKVAASVVKRIMATDPTFNPDYTATGHWNFFAKNAVQKKKDALCLLRNYRWSFEWKNTGAMGDAETPILYNDILGILQDATNCIWSDEWRVGASPIVEYTRWSWDVRTRIVCEDGGRISTKAGTFENCLKLCLDISGMDGGWEYRGGKKVYYFAPGIGIVRTENEYCGGTKTAVYELTEYRGMGTGYMPMGDGLMRRYDALNLTDGFVGGVEYTYVADEDGDIIIFADQTGVREVPPPITHYGAIQGEIVEETLWSEGKYEESRLRHDVNNFHLLCHFFGRDSRYRGAEEKAVAWNLYRLKIMEGLGSNQQVPTAWLGLYASTAFRTACALFGCGRKEEGYAWLEKAFDAYPNWDSIPHGAQMEVGDPLIYGDIKVVKGKGLLQLPNNTVESLPYSDLFDGDCGLMYYGMTAPYGWEWFNPVRKEERFQEYVERAKKMANQQ